MPKKAGGGGNNLRVIFKSILMINSLYCYSTGIAGPTLPPSVNENQEDLEVMFSSSTFCESEDMEEVGHLTPVSAVLFQGFHTIPL